MAVRGDFSRLRRVPAGESPAHLELKRLSLIWAQAHGYPIAACEVSLPNLRFRLDAAAYRPGSQRVVRFDERRGIHRIYTLPSVGVAAVFECKASRADMIRDCRNAARLTERLKELTALRTELERELRIHQPSLRNGDALWPEYESAAYERAEHPPYRKLVKTLATLSRQLQGQTKMENLFKWNAANLHYLVIEPGVAEDHETPPGWGLLVRSGRRLELRVLPELREVPEETRLGFLHRVAAAGTKAANREAGVAYAEIEAERRGMEWVEEEEDRAAGVPPANGPQIDSLR
ncbi:MAG: hypothetical protein JWO82_3062 [Akkermansiaceae bacterium]|nr:hypothetical protein [Akkermansiaceae bacterium]